MQELTNLKLLYKKRERLLKHLTNVKPLIDGSLVTIARKCGNPNCRCADGYKHESLYFTYKPQRRIKGEATKTKTIYVPVALEEEVRLWSKECAKIREIIRQVSQIQRDIIRSYVGQHGRTRKKEKEKKK